ncbi:hypothetical protein SMF1_0012 [Sulfolobales Mexican fusellovirus 1]|uniref:hypothetical protein n=1 Tax=Sulfolobales Mexican fusellovirus 1 TaxID=1298531 RepID=UPI0002C0BEFB|nr:hypothetical protein SMF1_0012 [Sulfolobales Mexican fusellovirus 1]AGG36559.1 hypothetical protein SMF1_0012 [Sulfolobales Mexican fusellovirus 1]
MSSEDSHSGDINLTPAPNWLEEFWKEFLTKLKQGDPKAKDFAKALGDAISDIKTSLVPTTFCQFAGSVFLCEPCPVHKSRVDAMVIYPDLENKKTLYFCLRDYTQKFEDPYAIPGMRLGDAQVLETYAKYLYKQTLDFERGEAEVIARVYILLKGRPKNVNKEVLVTLAEIYKRVFNKKAPVGVISLATDILVPRKVQFGDVVIEDAEPITPDTKTAMSAWEFTLSDVYAKIAGLYNFKNCYKVGHLLFCEPCPLHPDIPGDYAVFNPVAKIGEVKEPLWTCVHDAFTFHDRFSHSFSPLPEAIVDALDEIRESISREEKEKGYATLVALYFNMHMPREYRTEAIAKKELTRLYKSLTGYFPKQELVEKMYEMIKGGSNV